MVRIAKKQEITVQPNPLVADGQKVGFEIKASMPRKIEKDNYTYKLDVYYTYGEDKRDQIGTLNFEFGEFIYENRKPTIFKYFSFPYAPEKNPGKLFVQGRAINKKNEKVKLADPVQVAIGLNTTPLLIVRKNEINFIPDNYVEEVNKPATVLFYFDEGQARLYESFGSTLKALDQYAADVVPQQKIIVTASQSPDEYGTDIAKKRANMLEEHYRKRISILDYSDKKVSISTKINRSNWPLIGKKIQATGLPKGQKEEVLYIINSNSTDQEKATALQQTAAYDYLQRYVYPSLRSASVQIDYNRSRKADYELFILAKKIAEEKVDADVLTQEELQHAATLTPLLAEKKAFYEAAVKTTESWSAFHNLGKVYAEMARKEYRPKVKQLLLAKAIHNLTYAGFRNPTADVYYSLASAYHLRGEYLEALQYYDYAIKLGADEAMLQRVFADKAAVEIEIGQYDDAIESLTYAGDNYQTNMNMGLSYLLKENYEGAQGFYNKALELKPADALANYSLAIIGARTQNEQMLRQHLRRATRADNSFVKKSIDDLEFSSYRGRPAFEDALIR
ncbi:tetratricopeptide repeat protein [Pontibacter harenae]|uniref:tetratricopeptide repeat protein n=1 Tax=Pontibacter harenae TaxID=2894083 RepID=UPI001E3E0FDF|nr:tetratricopeptide repeat protein [Pontibacter harenae]MCC9166604.1 tetratricopeptide repeat protein [Pontibacter harenae]